MDKAKAPEMIRSESALCVNAVSRYHSNKVFVNKRLDLDTLGKPIQMFLQKKMKKDWQEIIKKGKKK